MPGTEKMKVSMRRLAAVVVVMSIIARPGLATAQAPEDAQPPSPVETRGVPAAPAAPAQVQPAPVPPDTAPSSPGTAVGPVRGPAAAVVKELRQGPLLIHGNYCGIGGRTGKPPIDAIDAACMRHDACTVTGKLPSCACNDRLRIEATAIVGDPRTPPDVKAIAAATAASMALLICKTRPTEAAPR